MPRVIIFCTQGLSTNTFQVETYKNLNNWNKYWTYSKIEQFGFFLQYDVYKKQIEWETVKSLIRLKAQSDQGLHCFVRPICPNT